MDTAIWVDGGNLLLQNPGSICHAAGGRYTGDEDFYAIGFEDFSDSAPVGDLHRGNGWPDGDKVESEETMAKNDGVLWRKVCQRRLRKYEGDGGLDGVHF